MPLWAPSRTGVTGGAIIFKYEEFASELIFWVWEKLAARLLQPSVGPWLPLFCGSEFLLNGAHYACDRQEGAGILCVEERYPFEEKRKEMNGFFYPAPT